MQRTPEALPAIHAQDLLAVPTPAFLLGTQTLPAGPGPSLQTCLLQLIECEVLGQSGEENLPKLGESF